MTPLIEVVACTADDAAAAQAAGAGRIELVSAISEGGLTPSLGMLREVRMRCSLPVVVMLRPRGGGFVYSEAEFSAMRRDAAIFAQEGVDGIVTGLLTEDGEVDRELLRLLGAEGAPVMFHRAFDLCRDPIAALDSLIAVGVRRVLTSGAAANARDGAAMLRQLYAHAAGRIEILAGGGVRAENAAELLRETGLSQIHLGPFLPRADAWSAGSYVEHMALDDVAVRRVAKALRVLS